MEEERISPHRYWTGKKYVSRDGVSLDRVRGTYPLTYLEEIILI